MRFLVDAQLPPGLAAWLNEAGCSAQHVADALATDAEDKDIVAHALRTESVIVTKDSDFLLLAPPPPILLVVSGNCSNRVLFEHFASGFKAALAKLRNGVDLAEIGRS